MGLNKLLLSSLFTSTLGTQTNSDDEVCNLLTVQCDLVTGFTVSIDDDCRKESFSQIPENYQDQGLFLTHIDLNKNPDKTEEVLNNLNKDCEFPGSGTLTFDFKTCGEMKAEKEDNTEFTIFTIYFNYRKKLGTDYISIVDQIPIQCKLGHVVMSTDEGAKIGLDVDDVLSYELIKGSEITSKFDLSLEIGTVKNGEFEKFLEEQAVDVGTIITIRLVSPETDYKFALMNCKAQSGEMFAPLYEDECPSDVAATSLGLNWLDFKSFNMPVFRIAAESEVTFSCGVGAFPTEEQLPAPCSTPVADKTSSRRRKRSNSEEKKQISVTIRLAPEKKSAISEAKSNDSNTRSSSSDLRSKIIVSIVTVISCIIF